MSLRYRTGDHKQKHWPKRSGKKTACGIHLLWMPMHEPRIEDMRDWEWWRVYASRQPINTDVTLDFAGVTCSKCFKSDLFRTDLYEWELGLADTTRKAEWDKQFRRGD